jgi:hypothetical protein
MFHTVTPEKTVRDSDTCVAQNDTGVCDSVKDLSLSDGASIWDQCLFKLGIT